VWIEDMTGILKEFFVSSGFFFNSKKQLVVKFLLWFLSKPKQREAGTSSILSSMAWNAQLKP
jgi:hypothetical protein